jgi:hypothetical protein
VSWEINGRSVTRAEFERFLGTLREVPGTWYCAETTTGGETGHHALDSAGNLYEYQAVTDDSGDRSTLRRRSGPGGAVDTTGGRA